MFERYVLLRHECPNGVPKPSHWDLMLESEGVLLTWELSELPTAWSQALGNAATGAATTVPATRLADHRLDYLDYEGPVSGNRGTVKQLDQGKLEWLENLPTKLLVELDGGLLSGRLGLEQLKTGWQLNVSEIC